MMEQPAIVKSACSLKERAARLKELQRKHVESALQQAIEEGAELAAAKDQCAAEGKGWLDWLAEIDYPRRTASRHLRLYENRDKISSTWATVAHVGVVEALITLAGDDPSDSAVPLCGRCQQTGEVEGCTMCAELRAGIPQREPGDEANQATSEAQPAEEAANQPTAVAPDIKRALKALGLIKAILLKYGIFPKHRPNMQLIANDLGAIGTNPFGRQG